MSSAVMLSWVPRGVGIRTVAQGMSRVPSSYAFQRRGLFVSSLARSDSDSPFQRAGPPPLPKEDQLEFERLVRENQSRWIYAHVRQVQLRGRGRRR